MTSTFCFSAKLCKGFVKEGRVWNIESLELYNHEWKYLPYSYTISGDTIIGGENFKKVYRKGSYIYGNEDWHYFGALQEVERKVFMIDKDDTEKYILYDFGMTQEESFVSKGMDCECRGKAYLELRGKLYKYIYIVPYFIGDEEQPIISIDIVDCIGKTNGGDPLDMDKWFIGGIRLVSVYDGNVCIATREEVVNAKYIDIPVPIDSNYFPTGMEWEETSVDLGQEEDNASSTTHYEIGEETTVDEQLYRKVLINGAESNLLIREEGSEVWLLTNEYPDEIKLYDFDWEKNETLQSEFLIKKNGEWILEEQEMQPEYKQTTVDTRDYEYHQDADLNTIVRGIGRVADRSRNSCLLGYKEPETIHPGQTYNKVTWVKRMGEEAFRSGDGKEWITYIPGSPVTSIPDAASLSKSKSGSGKTYTIGGQQTKASRRGIYIRDGEKFVVK